MSPESTPHPEVFAEDVRRTRRRGKLAGLLIGAVIVVIAILLLTLLGRCDGDDTVAAPAASSSPTTSRTAPSATPSPAAPGGIVNAGPKVLVPLSGPASLAAFSGAEATATAAPVQAVPADEGFWVGPSDADRVWLQLTLAEGESPFVVKAGQKVVFHGRVVANGANFADRVGVSDAEGAKLLATQGFHVAVARSDLRLLT